MYWNGNDKHLNPPDPIEWAQCEICSTKIDLGDMEVVGKDWHGDELYACRWCVEDYPEEVAQLKEKYEWSEK